MTTYRQGPAFRVCEHCGKARSYHKTLGDEFKCPGAWGDVIEQPVLTDAYVPLGNDTGPTETNKARQRYRRMPEGNAAKRGPIASHWELLVAGKWRRLYVSSRKPEHFVIVERQRVTVILVIKPEVLTD